MLGTKDEFFENDYIEIVKTNNIFNFAGRIFIDAFANLNLNLNLKNNNFYGHFQWPTGVGHSRTMNMIVI